MGDLKVVAAHREGDRVLIRWSSGAISAHLIAANLMVLARSMVSQQDGDAASQIDPDGHVWSAITGSQVSREDKITEAAAALASLRLRGPQERPASTVSPDSPELAALREIDKVLDQNWVADVWLNRSETLDVIHGIVRRILPEPHP